MKTFKELIYSPMPTKNVHASTVLPIDNGNVVAAWFGGSKEGKNDVDIWYSVRKNNNWEKPKNISYNKNIPHWNPVLFEKKNGDIILFFKVGKKIHSWRTFFSISKDGGETFSSPQQLVEGDISGGRGPVKNKPIRLQSGRIVAPASSEKKGWHCFVDISDDDCLSWKKSEKVKTERIAPILNSFNQYTSNAIPMIQPTLWESSPDNIHMITRTAVGRAYRSDSSDSGVTWCTAYPTCLPNNNSGIDLAKDDDGNLYLVSNPVSENWGERSPLTLSKSSDNGNSWETIFIFEGEKKNSEFSYPAIVCKNNKLYITYTFERSDIAYWEIEL